jgi:1-aminocyclopropane-1-carboxylate deaminase/D-cysteine desulfhydrase-like pyridoxal-dependent ACC family enzyme
MELNNLLISKGVAAGELQREPLPELFNNPFSYAPHPLVERAAREVEEFLNFKCDPYLRNALRGDGKMFGVLIVQKSNGETGYLAAYSGTHEELKETGFFVPPVYDLLSPDSFFPEEEHEIIMMNDLIRDLENDRYRFIHIEVTEEIRQSHLEKIAKLKEEYSASKIQRDARRKEIMEEMAKEFEKQGHKAYIIPEGASNAIGTLGYYNCMNEILEQEKELGIKFDTIVVATGSGGTYAGLYVANEVMNLGKRVIGMAVCDDTNYFTEIAHNIGSEALQYLPEHKDKVLDKSHIEINDKYVGIGYALSRPEELEFIKKFARQECVILDQVYTGKAMYGLYNELQEGGNINAKDNNILFIHTGGLFGLFTISEDFPL